MGKRFQEYLRDLQASTHVFFWLVVIAVAGLTATVVGTWYSSQISDYQRKIANGQADLQRTLTQLNALQGRQPAGGSAVASLQASPSDPPQPFDQATWLGKGDGQPLWQGLGRIELLEAYGSLGNAVFRVYVGTEERRIDMYRGARQLITVGGRTFFFDLWDVEYDRAKISITATPGLGAAVTSSN